MTKEERRVKVILSIHDENNENPQVKIDLQFPEQTSSLTNLIATYTKYSE